MAANNYNAYNYPYQQSPGQQYSAYQTAPAADIVAQPPRQYQQPPTSQASDYISYQGQSYGGQGGSYGAGQDGSWGSGYAAGTTRETTSRSAAEVLRNMSNNSYSSSSTAVSQPCFTATNTGTSQSARYPASSSNSPRAQPQQTHGAQSSYGQTKNRPNNMNANRTQQTPNRGLPSPATTAGYPSQRAQTICNQQQQRSASPAQHPCSNPSATPASSARSTAMTTAASQQHTDYDRRQLASVDASRTNQHATGSTPYNYGSVQTVPPPGYIVPPASSVPEAYNRHGSITVDPTAVYDPLPEYQRKQDALRAQRAVEDAARAEEERTAEEGRIANEAQKDEERKRPEEAEQAQAAASRSKQKAKKKQEENAAEPDSTAPEGDELESEIRAMMAKMRELNSKDPALLARIWEEERRAKASPKSPTIQNTSTAQASTASPAPAGQPNTSQLANQRKKAVPKGPVKPAAPVPVPVALAKPPATAVSTRHGGHTIWPPEKKTQLAAAAATYLNNQNPGGVVDPAMILSILDSNPSYVELCEQLERMELKLDRAAFAKNLLTAVPGVNSATREASIQPAPVAVQRPMVPAAIMKNDIGTPAASGPAFAAASQANRSSFPPFPDNSLSAATPVSVAEMIPIKSELKLPANKEEAARKRNLSDLVDLTQLSEDEDMGPPLKRFNAESTQSYDSSYAHGDDAMIVDSEPVIKSFPIASVPARVAHEPPPQAVQTVPSEIRYVTLVEPLEKKKALRRNNYNPATIARDVLLACGRHPSERQLNQHLDVLRTHLPLIGFDSDLSTIEWSILDPGNPPPGYFRDSVQGLTEDADDEDESEDEDKDACPRTASSVIGGESGVQALPEATNPFKQKRRGRPPRHSFPNDSSPATPKRSTSVTNMSASAHRPTAAGVGYQAFRSAVDYGPDGQPLPKKKGRPVGWRKAIHGSVAAQTRPAANGHTGPFEHQPMQPSSLRNVRTGGDEPIRIDSRSPSAAHRIPQFQSYKCKWQNCSAQLHNLETLKKHVFKVHRKETQGNTFDCLWGDCGKEVTNHDPTTNFMIEKHTPYSFDLESSWRSHIQQNHFDPLSWELGDGPAGGLSGNEDWVIRTWFHPASDLSLDAHDFEAYLSDAQGRRVTPRITIDAHQIDTDVPSSQDPASAPRGRGRPLKNTLEKEARDAHERLVSHKWRIGGPGMDRGGATLANEKRRRGFNDSDGAEEELVDVED